MQQELYDQLNKGWKTTCRILFGEEIGELKEFEGYLSEYPPFDRKESCVSGKKVRLVDERYSKDARFISSDEIKEEAIDPLTINEIKDIDSIVEAVCEKWRYCGNRILGNSAFIDSSDLVVDSQHVANCSNIERSSRVFSSFNVRDNSKYIYGSGYGGRCEFILHSYGFFNTKRMFECCLVTESSDVYFSHNCIGCQELLFSFFQRNKRYAIGNLELPKDKYTVLKKKLLSEVADDLKKNKRYPSLFKMVDNVEPAPKFKPQIGLKKIEEDKGEIEKAFTKACRVVLGCDVRGIDRYEDWLLKNAVRIKKIPTPFGNNTYIPEGLDYWVYSLIPEKRTVCYEEGMELGKLKMNEDELCSIEKIKEGLRKTGYFSAELLFGKIKNRIQSPLVYDASHVYKSYDGTFSEYVGLTSFAASSKYTFGCGRILQSQFVINCYNSTYLTRCFEVDTSTKCSDSYFCHNCEGLIDCMFCWNAKGKRNAIGNLSIEQSKYKGIKDAVIEQIAEELEKNGGLKLDIFNIGSTGEKLWYPKLMKH